MSIPDGQGTGSAEPEKPSAEETDDDILKEARERYQTCTSAEGDNRREALDDLLFLSGGLNQWNAEDARIRTAERRPCLTVNNLPTFLHQVTNEQRQNRLGGKVSPVDDGADEETADIIQGMVRHIEYDSNASVATMTAVNSAAAIGFGYFRLATDYETEASFDQKIMFKRIRNALSVHIDPLAQEPDASDQLFCFIDSLEARKEFTREHPKAAATNTSLIGQSPYLGWFTQETVLVCEYYRIKITEAILCLLADGTSGWKDELPAARHGEIVKERKSGRRVVEWFKMTGADILERTVIKCKWIPVFPVYGDEIDIEGRVVRSGIIRHSKDSFKTYNFWITLATEEMNTRAKSPFIGAEGQFEGHPEWKTANSRAHAYLEYKPKSLEGLLVPPPQRQPMADVPAGAIAMMMHAADNKKATTGLFDSSLGARGSATSGIQEREQQQQGDIANYHYADNLKITYKHALRCVVDMLPSYYDGARTARILGEDDESEVVKINQPFTRQNPKTQAIETVMHDLTVGTFDVTVQAGPSFSTKRQEAAEFMTDALQAAKDPGAAAVLTYLAVKNQDLAGAEEATKMLKKLLPPGVLEPEEGDEPVVQTPHGPLPISKAGQLIQQMGTALQEADKQLEKAQLDKIENQKHELAIKQQDADTKRAEAETARIAAESKSATDAEKVRADILKAEAERLQAEADLARAKAEEICAQPPVKAPTLEEIAGLVSAAKPQLPGGMVIKAPSGQAYEVNFNAPVQ